MGASLGTVAAPALPRGYVVYRGVSEAPLRPIYPEVAFQTWGPGIRFAAVPLPHGSAWYATFAQGQPLAQTETEKGMVPQGPLLEGIVRNIRDALESWHEPIDELLQATSRLSVEEAKASAFPWRGAARSKGRTVRIGDAAFTHDPLLAIGAGEAIREAALLASLLEEMLDRPAPHLEEVFVDQVRGELVKSQARRHRFLGALSNTAEVFGQTHWCRSRDLAMAVTPGPLRRGLFGWSIGQLGT